MSLHESEIRWHSEPFSYRRPSRRLTYSELWTVTEIEEVLATLAPDEIARWILDLICDREALRGTLHSLQGRPAVTARSRSTRPVSDAA
jgi:hypothetical protein